MTVFNSLRALIIKLDHQIDPFPLPPLTIHPDTTLDHIRTLLESGPLGDKDKDIFFPDWTKSLHILQSPQLPSDPTPTYDFVEANKITVNDPKQLATLLAKESDTPGITAVVVQQTRSLRYTRRDKPPKQDLNPVRRPKRWLSPSSHDSYPDPHMYAMVMYDASQYPDSVMPLNVYPHPMYTHPYYVHASLMPYAYGPSPPPQTPVFQHYNVPMHAMGPPFVANHN